MIGYGRNWSVYNWNIGERVVLGRSRMNEGGGRERERLCFPGRALSRCLDAPRSWSSRLVVRSGDYVMMTLTPVMDLPETQVMWLLHPNGARIASRMVSMLGWGGWTSMHFLLIGLHRSEMLTSATHRARLSAWQHAGIHTPGMGKLWATLGTSREKKAMMGEGVVGWFFDQLTA